MCVSGDLMEFRGILVEFNGIEWNLVEPTRPAVSIVGGKSYPLVNNHITMERSTILSWVNQLIISTGQFFIAMNTFTRG